MLRLGDKLLLNTTESIFEHGAHQCRFGAQCSQARSEKELFWEHVTAHRNSPKVPQLSEAKKRPDRGLAASVRELFSSLTYLFGFWIKLG